MRLTPRRLVVVGAVMVDILLYLDRMPDSGTTSIATRSVVAAGAGYNLLAGATRLGLPAAYAGLVGRGPFGTVVRRALDEINAPILLPGRDEDTGFDVGLVYADPDREPTFLDAPGVESQLEPSDLRGVALTAGDAVYLSGYDLWYPEQGRALATWITDLGPEYLFAFDPGRFAGDIDPHRLESAIDRADILSLTISEATALVSASDPAGLAEQLARRTRQDAWVVVRGGSGGCWVASQRGRPLHIPARPATPVDTTGAGDAHFAALLARLAVGDDFPRAAWWANLAGSLATEQHGPATCPSADELAEAASRVPGAWPR